MSTTHFFSGEIVNNGQGAGAGRLGLMGRQGWEIQGFRPRKSVVFAIYSQLWLVSQVVGMRGEEGNPGDKGMDGRKIS